MIIHGLSMAIGAAVAVVVMLAAFAVFSETEKPLNLVDTPPIKITAATLVENGSPRLGEKDAPVTIVEFGDYQCFFCNKFYHDTEKKLVSDFVDTGKISWVFKDFTIIGPDSVSAAIGARIVIPENHMLVQAMLYGRDYAKASSCTESLFHMAEKKTQLEKHFA